jgi:type IV pilus assembly protein PilW
MRIRRPGAGFSLVELMVGLVIGMVALLVVMQVFSVSEGFKRTTTGSSDAQVSGVIAMTTLQRDLRHAGHGISNVQLIGCNVALTAGWTLNAIAPVTINHASIPAGDANTDTLLVVYGNSNGSPEGDAIAAQPAVATFAVATPTSFAVGDQVIAEPQPRPAPCALRMEPATAVTAPAPPNVSVATGTAGVTNGVLFNLGQAPQILAYAVRGGNLTMCDYRANNCGDAGQVNNAAVWVPIGGDIVSLQVQYGRDTTAPTMDGQIDTFDRTTPTTACGWMRVSALRLALVSRSGQYEKTDVTTAAPSWAGSASAPIDLSGLPDWRRYRYRTFETTVPLRNMAWQGATPGC